MRAPSLNGDRLLRGLFVVLALAALAMYLVAIPLYYRDLAGGCLYNECGYNLTVTPGPAEVAAVGLSVPAYSGLLVAMEAASGLTFFAVGALLFVRAPHNRVALLGAVCLWAGGATYTSPLGALVGAMPAFFWPVRVLTVLGETALYLFLVVFPNGRFVPRFMRHFAVAFVVLSVVLSLVPSDLPTWENLWVLLPALFGLIFLLLSPAVAQIYRYRRVSTPAEREQTKWVVFGVSVALVVMVGVTIVGALYDAPAVAAWGLLFHLIYYGSIVLIPLALLGAILLSRLWSIDLLIRRTLVYTLLTAALVAVYLAVVVVLQAVVALLTGESRSTLVTVLSTLAIAALFSPLRRWVQAWIDRRFYRHRYDAARALAAFGASAREDVELDGLASRLVGVVEATMQPAHVSLWLKPAAEEQEAAEGAANPLVWGAVRSLSDVQPRSKGW